MQHLLIYITVGLIHSTLSQQAEKLVGLNPCSAKINCHECIQTASCAWCHQPDFGQSSRCFQPSMTSIPCPEKYIYQPDNYLTKLENRDLSKGNIRLKSDDSNENDWSETPRASGDIVQMRPQKVKLQLRINEPYNLDVWYAQAEDYPVDLYYLMDLSKSMEDDKKSLSILGAKLANTMKNITSKFQLGFGSFVDKVAMPYVSMVPKQLKEPCSGCAAPYGYRNVMSLSKNTDKFADEVRRSAVSGNLDAPEGGFDAIMQAIVCRNEIGWRDKARRLLVFSTDAGFHYAGDGKLGGIIKPNDGKCHLDNGGLYTYSSVQDYPSISQVNMKVKENAINIIFAVTSEQINVYDRLKDHIEGSSAGILSNDSSNVVDLVRDQYSKISSSIEMKDNSTSAVTIKYHSKCLGNGPEEPRRKCDGLKVGDVVKFTAEITVTSCPENPKDWNQIIQIYPVGINESLIVDLQMLCDCPCERKGEEGYKENSESCSNVGTYMCGVCDCGAQHFGQNCECSMDMLTSLSSVNSTGCRPDNTSLVDCSGRGTCTCGQCRCQSRGNDQIISGKFCECDNFSCDRHDGLLCSGLNHGRCECGTCVCERGWSGKACDCRSSNDTCISPESGEVCSGHGQCVCGQCVCDAGDEGRYSGQYCSKCHTCSARCEEFKDCVQCQAYKTGPLMEDDKCSKCSFVPITADHVEANEEKNEYLCAFYEDRCRFSFVYSYDEDEKVIIRAQEKLKCPLEVSVLGIVMSVIAAIVLIGLGLLLLWKMIMTVHDRREYAKFEKERKMAKWDTAQNPIYKQATSTFNNPTYSGN